MGLSLGTLSSIFALFFHVSAILGMSAQDSAQRYNSDYMGDWSFLQHVSISTIYFKNRFVSTIGYIFSMYSTGTNITPFFF